MAQLAANRAEDKFFSVLRDQREEFVRIEHSLALNAAASTDEAQRTSRAALERVYRAELGGIDDRFRVARSVIDSDPELANRYSDVLTRICNGWDDLKADWPAPQMAATVHEGLPRPSTSC